MAARTQHAACKHAARSTQHEACKHARTDRVADDRDGLLQGRGGGGRERRGVEELCGTGGGLPNNGALPRAPQKTRQTPPCTPAAAAAAQTRPAQRPPRTPRPRPSFFVIVTMDDVGTGGRKLRAGFGGQALFCATKQQHSNTTQLNATKTQITKLTSIARSASVPTASTAATNFSSLPRRLTLTFFCVVAFEKLCVCWGDDGDTHTHTYTHTHTSRGAATATTNSHTTHSQQDTLPACGGRRNARWSGCGALG